MLSAAGPVWAQRSQENAVRQAQDAFGFSVGGEAVGLYSIDSVRGFSPGDAGNIRVEGLYIDRQGYFSSRVVQSTSVRVGLNTLGYLFPAPSGIADFALRRPAGNGLAISTGLGDYQSYFVDVDAGLVSPDGKSSLAIGAAFHPDENNYRGSDGRWFNVGAVPRWRPNENIALTAYIDREQGRGTEVNPTYFSGGAYLPPRIARGRFLGQRWAKYAFNSANEGFIAEITPGDGWSVRAGAFHSVFNPLRNAFDIVGNVQPDGTADRAVLLFPEQRFASRSGDLQIQRQWIAGRARHTLRAGLRGRDADSRYGGEEVVDLGPYRVNEAAASPDPQVTFGRRQNIDAVRQVTGGLSYRLEWRKVIDLSLGVQKASYRKSFAPGGESVRTIESSPWLYDAALAWRVGPDLVVYGSYSRGLEESGTAPGNAANVGEVLPAIRTTQREMGFRTKLGAFGLTAAAFDIERPYPALDEQNLYRLVGQVWHRGIETSLSGEPVPGLSLLAGLLVLDAQVSGPDVEAGLRGDRPIGQTPLQFQGSADYRLSSLPGLSLDASLAASGRRTSRRDEEADVPQRALVNLGLRYRFKLAGRPATLRGQLVNLTDTYGLNVNGDGAYDYIAGRRWRLTLAADF